MNTLRHLVLWAAIVGAGAVLAVEPLDINTATAEMLAETISGVGMKRAEAIIAYREQHGPFQSLDELAEIRGIGNQIIEQSRDKLTVKVKAQ